MKKTAILFLVVILSVSFFSCAEKKPDSTKSCMGMEDIYAELGCGGTTPGTTAAITQAVAAGLGGDNRFYWHGKYANTLDEYAYVIKNEKWSASAEPVSYSKILLSAEDVRAEMKEVCGNTAETEAIYANFSEAFFEENALLYLTLNTTEKPSSLTIVGMEKGKNLNIIVNCVAQENITVDMASYTVLVIFPQTEVAGNEQIKVQVT